MHDGGAGRFNLPAVFPLSGTRAGRVLRGSKRSSRQEAGVIDPHHRFLKEVVFMGNHADT